MGYARVWRYLSGKAVNRRRRDNVMTNNNLQNTTQIEQHEPHWKLEMKCSTSETRRVNLVTNPVISQEWGKDQEVLPASFHLWTDIA